MLSPCPNELEDYTRALTPEQNLYVAVMRRAVWDYVHYQDSEDELKRQHHLDAKAWFLDDELDDVDEDGRVSFRYLCDVFGVDPDYMLSEMMSLTREQLRVLNNHLKDG